MKTTNLEKVVDHTGPAFIEGLKKTIETIKLRVANSNGKYIIDGDITILDSETLIERANKLGICDRRRLRNKMNKVIFSTSLRSMNLFFHFIMRHVLDCNTKNVRILEPKHEAIQEARKKWKEAQAIADAAHSKYVKDKSDYYKK
jgi:hypothetical protein